MASLVVRKGEVVSEDEELDEFYEEEEDDEDSQMLIDSKLIMDNSKSTIKPAGHKCLSCNKYFTTNNLMLQHYSAVHEKKRFPCSYCRETFAYRSGRTRHIHSVHQMLRFKCTLCKLTYTSRETAQTHVKTKHKIKEKVDFYLEKLSATTAAHATGTTTHTDSAALFLHKNEQNVVNALKKRDNKGQILPAAAASRFGYSVQKFVHENGFVNDSTNNAIKSITNANNNESTSSSGPLSSKERLKCFLCDKTFAYNAGRSKHIRIVHMNVRYRCMLCHSSYTTRDYAVQHVSSAHCIESKHPTDYVERIQDDLPQQTSAAASASASLNNNNKSSLFEEYQDFEDDSSQGAMEDFEEDDNDHDDDDGDGAFADNNNKMITCNNNPSQPHDIANATAVSNNNNNNGSANNLPFHCLQCGVGFETQEILMYHVNLEHEEQKISCDYCGKSMLRPASLVGHMKVKHADISYRCTLCGLVFACPAVGSYHIEDVHQCDPSEHLEHVPTTGCTSSSSSTST